MRIELLWTAYPALTGFPKPIEEGASRCAEIVGAECPLCHMQINSGELRQLSEIESDAVPKDPLLRRLHAGQCIRQNCESSLYHLSIAVSAAEHWPEIEKRILLASQCAEAARESEPTAHPMRTRMVIGTACLLLAIIASFLFQHWVFGYPIPWLQKRRTFPIDNVGTVTE
jgi:hypothetical protein